MSVKVQQCRQCKRLFQSYGSEMCPDCAEKMDQDFTSVKEYIYENPNANVIEISKETGVAEKKVLHFLRDGRLSVSEKNAILTCIECGSPIVSGKYCAVCTGRLDKALRSAIQSKTTKRTVEKNAKTNSVGRMHSDYNKRTF